MIRPDRLLAAAVITLLFFVLPANSAFAETSQLFSSPGTTDKRTVNICVDPDWLPFEKIDAAGNYIGIAADFMAHFSRQLNLELQLIPTASWQQSLDYTRSGQCSLLPFLNKTPERSEYLTFSDSYFESPIVLISHEDNYLPSGFNSLSGKSLALVEGYSYMGFIRKNYPDIKLIKVSSMDRALSMVADKKADATTAALYMFPYQMQQLRLNSLKIASATEVVNQFRIGAHKSAADLIPRFNQEISQIPSHLKNETILKWTPDKPISDRATDHPIFILIVFTTASFAIWLIWQANQKLKNHNHRLTKIATTDALTGVANRVQLNKVIESELNNSQLSGRLFSLVMLDIDHFKKINDTLGHDAGDKVLCSVTQRINASIRSSDTLARWGGEEFVILSPNTNIDQAEMLADKLRRAIRDTPIESVGTITASFGITVYRPGDNQSTLFKRADNALYEAKKSGRDCIKLAEQGNMGGS